MVLVSDQFLQMVHLYLFLDAGLLGGNLVAESLSLLHVHAVLLGSFQPSLDFTDFLISTFEILLVFFSLPSSSLGRLLA